MFLARIHKLIFFISFAIITTSIAAQSVLPDVPKAFASITSNAQVIRCKSKSFKIPAGGHLQGIQALADSTVIVTASSGSYSYYITAQIKPAKGKGHINKLQAITQGPYRHAGGCQVNDHQLFVGVEDNVAKNRSQILMISFNDSLRQTGKHIIALRGGMFKRSTAGATGVSKTKTGQYLVAVGDWDTKNIDFYLSRPGTDTLFDSLTTFHTPSAQKWYSYQSVNVLTDTTGNIYLVGFALDGLNNRADLYKVQLQKTGATLEQVSTRNFKCKGGAGFRYGSGISVEANRLSVYSCSRGAKPLVVNVFRYSIP